MTEGKPMRYSAKRLKDGYKPYKRKNELQPENYTVQRSKWCKYPLEGGKECKAPRVSGKDGCIHHNSKDGGRYQQEVAHNAADKFALPEMDLNTIQDVISFLGKLIMCFKSGGCDKNMADTLARLCKELISAIKERDSNSPEAVQKKREEIMAVVMAARQLGVDAAREVLLSRNFELLEMKAEQLHVEVIQPETNNEPARGQEGDEGSAS